MTSRQLMIGADTICVIYTIFLTGVLVAIILMLLQVKMAVLFGLLSFLLNFVSISMD